MTPNSCKTNGSFGAMSNASFKYFCAIIILFVNEHSNPIYKRGKWHLNIHKPQDKKCFISFQYLMKPNHY